MDGLLFEIIGYMAGLCTAFAFMPQSIKTIKTKDVKALSLPTYLIFIFGLFLWTIYGYYLGSTQMMLFNILSLSFALPILYMILKYKK